MSTVLVGEARREKIKYFIHKISAGKPLSAYETAEVLNLTGYPTKTGKPWSRQAVEYVEQEAMQRIREELKQEPSGMEGSLAEG
jgi:hypothetical protein